MDLVAGPGVSGRVGPGDGHVGADPVQPVQHAGLRVAGSCGDGADRDHQGDADGQAGRDEDRLPQTVAEFEAKVREEEHEGRSTGPALSET
jgi:hypothetical protein